MRILEKDIVEDQLEKLLDNIEKEGPFLVRSDGKDVAVALPPKLYEALVKGAKGNLDGAL